MLVVSPKSLRTWFRNFLEEDDKRTVYLADEEEALDEELLRICSIAATTASYKDPIVILSSHYSLARDFDLSSLLRECAEHVVGPTRIAKEIGLDKVAMKHLLAKHGIDTPRWTESVATAQEMLHSESALVIKPRSGTMGLDCSLVSSADKLPSDLGGRYAECFVAGVEYSVIAGEGADGWHTFPPVWKGETRPDLLPPYKRLRLCPSPAYVVNEEAAMRETTRRIADAIGPCGTIEVEFVVPPDGAPTVLEVNPRVSGTMRISAMAADSRIFSLIAAPGTPRNIPALRTAAEVPLSSMWQSSVDWAQSTSRLTVVGDDPDEVRQRLQDLAAAGASFERGYLSQSALADW